MNEVMTKTAVRGAEWQKMVAGAPYDAGDPELKAARERCRRLYHTFNTSWQEKPARDALLHELLGGRGPECAINPPFFCDYGANIFVGENFYANVGCTILDVCEVHIGERAAGAWGADLHRRSPGCRGAAYQGGGVRQAGSDRPQRLDWRQRRDLPRRYYR